MSAAARKMYRTDMRNAIMISLRRYSKAGSESMGSVRVRVKLTNEIDERLAGRGLLNPSLVRVCEIEALVDTGAARLVLPVDVVRALGIRIQGQQLATYADGRQEVLGLTEVLIVEVLGFVSLQPALVVTGTEVLIGQAVLEELDLLVDCKRQRLVVHTANPEEPL
jgi:predicted aspartyl protease